MMHLYPGFIVTIAYISTVRGAAYILTSCKVSPVLFAGRGSLLSVVHVLERLASGCLGVDGVADVYPVV